MDDHGGYRHWRDGVDRQRGCAGARCAVHWDCELGHDDAPRQVSRGAEQVAREVHQRRGVCRGSNRNAKQCDLHKAQAQPCGRRRRNRPKPYALPDGRYQAEREQIRARGVRLWRRARVAQPAREHAAAAQHQHRLRLHPGRRKQLRADSCLTGQPLPGAPRRGCRRLRASSCRAGPGLAQQASL